MITVYRIEYSVHIEYIIVFNDNKKKDLNWKISSNLTKKIGYVNIEDK